MVVISSSLKIDLLNQQENRNSNSPRYGMTAVAKYLPNSLDDVSTIRGDPNAVLVTLRLILRIPVLLEISIISENGFSKEYTL
jgi:hypothetical protein